MISVFATLALGLTIICQTVAANQQEIPEYNLDDYARQFYLSNDTNSQIVVGTAIFFTLMAPALVVLYLYLTQSAQKRRRNGQSYDNGYNKYARYRNIKCYVGV